MTTKRIKATEPEPRRTAPARPLDDRLAEALRRMAVADGAVKGKYADLGEMAKERWRVRARHFQEAAEKLKVGIVDGEIVKQGD